MTTPRSRVGQEKEKVTEPVPTRKERPLTLKEIRASEFLMKSGILAGDLVNDETKKITRVYSSPEDALNEGKILTQDDINNSPFLQQNNVKAGDRAYDGQIYRTNRDNAWAQAQYQWDESESITGSWAVFMESHFPMGEFRVDFDKDSFLSFSHVKPDALYGEGFSKATPEQRREMIVAKKERELQREHGQFFEKDPDSLAGATAGIAKSLLDPTTLIPVGQTVKGMALSGGALTGLYSAGEQYRTEGEIDPVETAAMSALGATSTAVVGVGINKIAERSANKLIDKAQTKINEHINKGGEVRELQTVLKDSGINPLAVQRAMNKTGKKVHIPLGKTHAERAVADSIARDSAVSRLYSKGLDKYLGTLSTRLGNISEGMKGKLRSYEYDVHTKTANLSKAVEPFLVKLKRLPEGSKQQLTRLLYNGNLKAAQGVMKTIDPDMAKEFDEIVKPVLNSLGDDLLEAGHTFEKLDNYFPRSVKDVDKLRESFGLETSGIISKQLQEYAKKNQKSVQNLTADEKAQVIDLTLRGYRQTVDGGKPRFAKQRKIATIEDPQLQYYAPPEESLSMYIRNAVHDIETRKFFGRTAKKNESGKFDADLSIGSFVEDALNAGQINPAREQELLEILQARFIGGTQSPHGVAQTIRDLGYMGTIANPVSAVTQLADVSVASALTGFRNAIAGMFGTKEIKLVDLGIEDLIATELAMGGARKTSVLLGKLMTGAGFRRIDQLGKETFINASLKEARNLVKSPKGEAQLRDKVRYIFGDETDSFIADMKAGRITDNVKLFAFNKLADVQPIALSEMPEGYLRAKNMRLLYMLKSFTLKQIDLARREVIQEWKKGNKKQAVKSAALLAGYMSVANVGTQTIKDIMLGRDVRLEDVPDKALWALLGIYGLNQYTYDRYLSKGKLKEGTLAYIAPATPVIDAVLTLGTELPKDDPKLEPVLRGVPFVGPLLYSWFGGGAEKYNERLRKEK